MLNVLVSGWGRVGRGVRVPGPGAEGMPWMRCSGPGRLPGSSSFSCGLSGSPCCSQGSEWSLHPTMGTFKILHKNRYISRNTRYMMLLQEQWPLNITSIYGQLHLLTWGQLHDPIEENHKNLWDNRGHLLMITTIKYPQEQVESNVKDLLTSTCQVSSGLKGRGPRFIPHCM